MRSTPIPCNDGVHFRVFNASSVNGNSKRVKIKRTANTVKKHARKRVERTLDMVDAARTVLEHKVDPTTATKARDLCIYAPRKIFVCVPELQAQKQMLAFPPTQVKNGAGQVIGVKTCCPACMSNKHVEFLDPRVRKCWDAHEVAHVIDIRCACTNPECSGYKAAVEKKSTLKKVTKGKTAAAKAAKVRYTFSNIAARTRASASWGSTCRPTRCTSCSSRP